MTALLLGGLEGSSAVPLTRRALVGGAGSDGGVAARYDERWLQQLLFTHPELIPLERIEPGAGEMVPLCRELAMPRSGGVVFLDLLGITRAGRLVLVECKLWRNPQARREVVAQILEYAALLRGWSFGDLTARLKQKEGWSGANPIFTRAKERWPDLDEALFVDGLSRSLQAGDFHLAIAGDGIRSDLQAIAEHLNASNGGAARLSLLEIQLWADGAGRTLIVPSVPLRTEVIQQRVLITESGTPLRVEEVPSSTASAEAVEQVVDPDQQARRGENRAFWQRFIDEVRFDHPDQPLPRHGGNNWVRIDLPAPASWLTAYRTADKVGLFVTLTGEDGEALLRSLSAELEAMKVESGLDLTVSTRSTDPFKGDLSVARPRSELAGDAGQLAWLTDAANRFVTLIRPRLCRMAGEGT